MSLNIAYFIDIAAQATPDKAAVIAEGQHLTYGELVASSRKVSNILLDKGVSKGDKVALMVPNNAFFPMIYYGILRAGATVVPINTMLKAQEIQYHLEDSDAKVFFVWKAFFQDAARACSNAGTCHHLIFVDEEPDSQPIAGGESFTGLLSSASTACEIRETMPDDTAVILYTSGTTGHPKGAELTHFNMFFNAFYTRDSILRATASDMALAILPLFHSFGQTCVLNAVLMAGGAITMLARFDPLKALQTIQRDKVTIIAAVPTMYLFLVNTQISKPHDVSSLRVALSGGSSLPVETLQRFENEFGLPVLEGYGLSETSPVASFNLPHLPRKPGSIGVPIWGCEMRVIREDGTFAGPGTVGEIVIRGHNVMKGYYKKPVATQEAVVDGWLHTGDMAKTDAEGYFFIVDRKKDIIIRSGMNIYPREIEEILYGHPAVLEAAVVGVPDDVRGEEVKAYIALKEKTTVRPEELRSYCRERIAAYKCPKEYEILPSLPKGPTGKILKRELRKRSLAS
jgi:long-chain acyl-CoA synthetase